MFLLARGPDLVKAQKPLSPTSSSALMLLIRMAYSRRFVSWPLAINLNRPGSNLTAVPKVFIQVRFVNIDQSSGGGGKRRGGARSPPPPPPPGNPGRGQFRSAVPPGTLVGVIQKAHQRSGEVTHGVVARSLGSTPHHPRGIKVLLECGTVGRVFAVHDASYGPTA